MIVRAGVIGLLLAGALLAGCTTGSAPARPTKTVTVTLHRSPTPTPSSSAPSSPSSSAPPSLTALPGGCGSLLPDYDVAHALGLTHFAGADAFVVGQPETDIGRIGYLNCRYGVTGGGVAALPQVEIGISLYRTPAQAAARVAATVTAYTSSGARATPGTADGHPATLLTGGSGAGYAVPTLVVAAGQRTVAVSLASSVARGSTVPARAAALASLALARSGG